MALAVSAGAYGNNDTDSLFPGRPEPDLYRFWTHGQQDGLTNPNLGTTPYFAGAGFAAEERINMYNADDFALDLWDVNNLSKEAVDEFIDPFEDPYYPSALWPFGYIWESGPDRDLNANDDTFERYNPDETLNATLTSLVTSFGRPGADAYEILAFFSQSASTAVGTKSVSAFDQNIDIQTFGLEGGNDIRANHSYQFNHDAAETWDFYDRIKTELGFDATHNQLAAATTTSRTDEQTALLSALAMQDGFSPHTRSDSRSTKQTTNQLAAVQTETAIRRLALVEKYFERGYESAHAELEQQTSRHSQ